MTVSNAHINPDRVAPATLERVLECARRLGYVPNMAARRLAGQSTQLIGVVIDLREPLSASLLKGVDDVMRDAGYLLQIIDAREQSSDRQARANVLRSSGAADVMIVNAPFVDSTGNLVADLQSAEQEGARRALRVIALVRTGEPECRQDRPKGDARSTWGDGSRSRSREGK